MPEIGLCNGCATVCEAAGHGAMELKSLDYREFELLVGLLLSRSGFRIIRAPSTSPLDSAFATDFEAVSPDNALTFVEVKHYRQSARLPSSVLHQFIGELERIRVQHPHARGILVTSATLTEHAAHTAHDRGYITIWDGKAVESLADAHPDVVSQVTEARSHREELNAQLSALVTNEPRARSRYDRLIAQLQSVVPGRGAWKDYENVCAQLLTDLFTPHLGAPSIQTRSDDGLDIMDAIFPIRASQPPWLLVRSDYHSRFVVAEFKNYGEPIGQRQVESLEQYLYKKAQRSFGLLISRRGPDQSARLARRRAWVEHEKMIIFLDDEDLADMAQLRDEGEDPFQVIDAQLEEFLRTLSP